MMLKNNLQTIMKKHSAFSLIELSIVILIIGILVAGVTQGSRLVKAMRLSTAKNITTSSPVASMKDLIFWFETVRENSLDQGLEDGDSVLTWNSVNPQATSTVALQAGGSNRPTYEEDGIGGLPSVDFNADYLSYSGFALSANYTIFAVFKTRSLAVDGGDIVAIFNSSDLFGVELLIRSSGAFRALHRSPMAATGGNDNESISPNLIALNRDYIISYVRNYDANLASVWANNVAFISNQTATDPVLNSSSLTLLLGKLLLSSSVRQLDALFSELIIFDRALKQSEINEVEEYLSKKYKINI